MAYIIKDLDLREDIVRLPVTEMGCAAAYRAIYAKNSFKSNPTKGLP